MKTIYLKLAIYCFSIAVPFFVTSCASKKPAETTLENLTQYVDPFIGTGDHGHVFLGADVPFGAVQAGPVNLSQGWDWCSGYHISDSTICGFSQTHLSGTGIGDLGDITLMPVTGEVKLAKGVPSDLSSGFFSLFSHEKEKAKPGYYSVHLDRYGIDVELTATARVGFHKYTFPKANDAKIIIDLQQGIGWDQPMETYITQESDTSISGYRFSKGWANDQRIYFHAVFSKPMTSFAATDSTVILDSNTSLKGRKVKGVAYFSTEAKDPLYVKVAISPVSIANAKENLDVELPGWDFDTTVQTADAAWNKELNKIVIQGDEKTKRIFYTALYHTMIAPSLFCDVNGDYWGPDKQTHKNTSGNTYTTFSLWDTYRAAHPLMTIIHPEKVNDMIHTMLQIYEQQGKLPVWHLVGNETDCMVGNPGIIVVADAILKDYSGFDHQLAFEAMQASAMLDERGLDYVKKQGFIPSDSVNEAVAKGLEYAIADWSIGQVAKKMNMKEEYEYFNNRGKAYRYYFDPSTHFMRGKLANNEWRTPFNPFQSIHRMNDFTEGNAWQYTWLVPQDVEGLINLFGSESRFIEKLDSLFIAEGDLGKEASPDISGLIGQYAHGNEPSHQIVYMYTYAGQPWKTAQRVRQILSELYHDQPAGLCGNEDVGQMSAWYILSAMGFYQVNPANSCYVFGSPAVNEASIKLPNGRTFDITAKDNSPENIYIQSITLNGKPYTKSYIHFNDIMSGGKLVLQMGNKPSETYGVSPEDRPYSEKE